MDNDWSDWSDTISDTTNNDDNWLETMSSTNNMDSNLKNKPYFLILVVFLFLCLCCFDRTGTILKVFILLHAVLACLKEETLSWKPHGLISLLKDGLYKKYEFSCPCQWMALSCVML